MPLNICSRLWSYLQGSHFRWLDWRPDKNAGDEEAASNFREVSDAFEHLLKASESTFSFCFFEIVIRCKVS